MTDLSSIIVLHAGALGDFVLTYHVLARLRQASPQLHIDVVARSPFAQWTAGRGVIDTAHDYHGYGLEQLFHSAGDYRSPLAQKLSQYDLVLSLLGDRSSTPASFLRRAGLNAICIDPAPTEDTIRMRRHITEQWTEALASEGLTGVASATHVPDRTENAAELVMNPNAEERRSARKSLAALIGSDCGPRVIVHPGSGSRAKCCSIDALEPVVAELRKRGCGVVWMLGPTELDWYGQEWVARLRRAAPVVHEDDVSAAASLISGADAYLGNDAGMTHVAAALGVNTVALFGPTDPHVWRPQGPRFSVVECGTHFDHLDAPALLTTLLKRSRDRKGAD